METNMEYPHKEFTYRGIKVIINVFTDKIGRILDYAAKFYQGDSRWIVVNHGWNYLIAGNMNDCVQKSKLFIDARLDNDNITLIKEWEDLK